MLTVNKDANVSSITVKVGSTTISPVTSGGNTYWIDKGANPTVEATTKSGYVITNGTGSIGAVNAAKTVNLKSIAGLKFSSDEPFTLSAPKRWDSTLEYTLDNGNTWSTWNGSELNGIASQPIYLRGTGNTVISNGNEWTFTGKYITGNIETLLDYQKVINGQHPVMGANCYNTMFNGCTSLTTAPELPATTLAEYCYQFMFRKCTSLTTAPKLPATTLAEHCYNSMFSGCTSLTIAPELPATTLASNCYLFMFQGCTSITTAPELPATTLAEYCYSCMFQHCTSLTTAPKLPATTLASNCYFAMFTSCTSLKLSITQTDEYQYEYRIPIYGTGTTADNALMSMFNKTGGTFTGTPDINTAYYTDHKPV